MGKLAKKFVVDYFVRCVLDTVLIYDLAKQHLVEDLKYPPDLADMQYDKDFAIMVRHL